MTIILKIAFIIFIIINFISIDSKTTEIERVLKKRNKRKFFIDTIDLSTKYNGDSIKNDHLASYIKHEVRKYICKIKEDRGDHILIEFSYTTQKISSFDKNNYLILISYALEPKR